jgi:hypothetical protein
MTTKSRKSSKRTKRSSTSSGKVSFAFKLGAFLLQNVKGKIVFSLKEGFSDKHPQIFGVLPYLHMNITEEEFRQTLNNSKKSRTKTLKKACNSKKMNTKLKSVKFSCNKQSAAGIDSLDNSLLDSINNRLDIRENGEKLLREILAFMKSQVKEGIIPHESIEWGKNL